MDGFRSRDFKIFSVSHTGRRHGEVITPVPILFSLISRSS